MFAEIITIGDELLIGQIVDTNSAWMGQELNKIGIEVLRIVSIRDREKEILEAIDNAMERVNIVLVTGGLGPTKDDITVQSFGTIAWLLLSAFIGIFPASTRFTFSNTSSLKTSSSYCFNP